MESTPRFARLTTVLRPSPRLPPVTTAIFAAEIPSFLVAMLFVAPFLWDSVRRPALRMKT